MAEPAGTRRPDLIVLGVGGNALATPGVPIDGATQRSAVIEAAQVLAEVVRDRSAVLTHGSGPQVGLLARQRGWPLDVLDAEAAGMIGYVLDQELGNHLPDRPIATLLTQIEVDPDDPAFAMPTKPIGPAGDRHLVASPEPQRIIELHTIELLVDAGVLVVCAGGGGIPVVTDASGARRGVEAVIDKDRATALLAIGLGAADLVLLTDVDGVYDRWGTDEATRIDRARAADLGTSAFAAGSMGPKVEAACRFVQATGGTAHIGALADAPAVASGDAGTTITR
jgi:carbamate kinase